MVQSPHFNRLRAERFGMPRAGQHHSEEAKEKIRVALVATHPTRGMEKVDGDWIPRRPRNPRGFFSTETRKKMSEAMKKRTGVLSPAYGRCYSAEDRFMMSIARTGERHPMYGRHHSEESKEKMRASHRGKTGDKSSRWMGGITPLVRKVRQCTEYRQWRINVFTRDDFTCVFCGIRGCFIEADHYPKPFAGIFNENKIESLEQAIACDELWDISNGRTLCRKCHDTTKQGRRKAVICLLN